MLSWRYFPSKPATAPPHPAARRAWQRRIRHARPCARGDPPDRALLLASVPVVHPPPPVHELRGGRHLAALRLRPDTNAAKYTPEGGHIRLAVRHEGGLVTFGVADDGIGIPPEKIPEMFELFAQGDRTPARSEGGLGIGLTLVRRIAEMHGG